MTTNPGEKYALGSSKENNTKWIRLGNKQYNVTNFTHPGGSVMNYMEVSHSNGSDAQHAFKQFHLRSARAKGILNVLPVKPYVPTTNLDDEAMLKDYVDFTELLEEEGFFKGNFTWTVLRILELVVIFAIGSYLFSIGWSVSGAAVWGLFGGRCGWVQHEGGHNSLSGVSWIDKKIQEVTIGFGLLTSGNMWNSMHNKHHACPQKAKHDMDLDTMPLVAFYFGAAKDANRGINLLWMRFQKYTFLPITSGCFVMLFWLY